MMAEELSSRELQRQLTTCHICSKTFHEPKLLPCLDSFCSKCLEEVCLKQPSVSAVRTSVVCPTCGERASIPSEGLQGFPDNSFAVVLIEIAKLHEEQTSPKICCSACARSISDCSQLPVAVVYCVVCEDKLCTACSDAHRKLKVTRDHRLVQFDADFMSKLSEARQSKPTNCQEHSDMDCTLYCQNTDCQKAICLKCAVLTHKTHDYADIAVVAAALRKDLLQVNDRLSGKLQRLAQQFRDVETRRKLVQDSTKDVEKSLDQRSEVVLNLIKDGHNELAGCAGNLHAQDMKLLKARETALHNQLSNLYQVLMFGQTLAKQGNDVEIGSVVEQFKRKTDEVIHGLQTKTRALLLTYVAQHSAYALNNASVVLGSVSTSECVSTEKSTETKIAAEEVTPLESQHSKRTQSVAAKHADNSEKETGALKWKTPRLKDKVNGKDPVRGIALIEDQLFILHKSAGTVKVYNAHSLVSTGTIDVKGLLAPIDMAGCSGTKRLYISDKNQSKVFRVGLLSDRKTNVDAHKLERNPCGLSVTPNLYVLVAHPKNACFSVFTDKWQIVHVVETPGEAPFQVVYQTNDCFVICSDSSSNSVSILHMDEKQKSAAGNPVARRIHQLVDIKRPTHVRVLANQLILIVESHRHRIFVADSNLSKILWSHQDSYTKGLYRCCLNEDANKLYIGIENCLQNVTLSMFEL